jgi:hypothetical protein
MKGTRKKTVKKVTGKNTSHGLNRLNTDNAAQMMQTASHYYEQPQLQGAYTADRFAKDY